MNGELDVVTAAGTIRVRPPGPAVVGRANSSTIAIADPGVSTRHGELRLVGDTWEYHDLRSTNGTFHRGTRIDRLRIEGHVELSLGGPDGATLDIRSVTPAVPSALHTYASATPAVTPAGLPLPLPAPIDGGTTNWFRRQRGPMVVATMTVGRAADADLRVDDMLASRYHARLELLADDTARMVDLGSVNGTFVDGLPATPSLALNPGQRVTIGNTTLLFDGRSLGPARDMAPVVFAVEGLTTTVETKQGLRTLLGDVSFALPRGSLMAVLGPSGAGKSTLLGAITGTRPATSGVVRFNGLDLYRNYGEVRSRIGFVPQEDILHPLLTITRAMKHAARLRFPADTTQAERDARIATVLAQLNLTEHAEKKISALSGGQRKRVNVALELLSEPDLLILDEPTSGLDPGMERSVMEQLRSLADSGRTVIVVSHSTESLHLCDQVLMLAPGGKMAFQGPVAESLGFLGAKDYPEAFQMVERANADDLRQRFMASRWAAGARPGSSPPPPGGGGVPRPADRRWAVIHFQTFVARYLDVMKGDRRGSIVLALQAPIMALLMLAVFGANALTVGPDSSKAGNVLMALVLGAIYMGASNSAREIVKERSILRREQSFGVSIVAYLASKAAVLGAITVVQALVLVAVGTARQGGPDDAVLLASGRVELFVAVAVCGLSAMMLGLLVSATVTTTDKATTILPVMLFAQFLLAGLTFPIDGVGVAQLSWLSSARWGLGAVAATADYPLLSGCRIPGSPVADVCGDWWGHTAGDWLGNVAVLGVLTISFGAIAYVRLRREDPARALAARR